MHEDVWIQSELDASGTACEAANNLATEFLFFLGLLQVRPRRGIAFREDVRRNDRQCKTEIQILRVQANWCACKLFSFARH